jgi:hypothetical protein
MANDTLHFKKTLLLVTQTLRLKQVAALAMALQIASPAWAEEAAKSYEDDEPVDTVDRDDDTTATSDQASPFGSSQESYPDFSVMIHGVPDFDQKRRGRLSLDGNFHCVPTASLNILTWLGNLGHADEFRGLDTPNTIDNKEFYCSSDLALEEDSGKLRRNSFEDLCHDSDAWLLDFDPYESAGGVFAELGDAIRYEQVSEKIEALGYEMDTNGLDGPHDVRTEDDPTGTQAMDVAARVIRSNSEDVNVTNHAGADCKASLDLEVLRDTLSSYGVALMTIGWYEPVDDKSTRLKRTGGHFVTVTGLTEKKEEKSVFFRDPARMGVVADIDAEYPEVLCSSPDSCRDRQDPFFTEAGTMTQERIKIVDGDKTCTRTRWLITWADGEKRGYLDNFVTVVPR